MICLLALLLAPLQGSLDRIMDGKAGAAAVMDVASGRVLASHGLDKSRAAAPGSALKPFTLYALLEAGLADTRLCERRLRIGARRLDCTHPAITMPIEAASALAYSCNCFFAAQGARLDPGKFARELQEFGLASHGGRIQTAAGREEMQLQTLGESGIEVTPLGLLSAYRKLALLRRSSDPKFAPLFEGLEGCVEYGTGQLAMPAGMRAAGKTGTAAAKGRRYRHAWFVGYAPADAPEIAVAVFLEGGSGGADAAPVAKRIFEAWRGGSCASSRKRVKAPDEATVAAGKGKHPGCAGSCARERERMVRLFSVEAPAAASVAAGKGRCLVRSCPGCAERPVEGHTALRPGVSFNGSCALEVPGHASLALSWPVEVRSSRGKLALIARMPTEDYVSAVLAGEGSVLRSEEALKAMAVTARTFAAANGGRHRDEGFDFCDTTHCQDARLAVIPDRLRAAADATEGEILWYQGSPAQVFFHRDCGGTTENASDVWPRLAAPYLRSQPDTFCVSRGRSEWRAEIPAKDLARALGIGRLDEITVLRRSGSGRALELSAGGRRLSADAFHLAVGRALGWNLIRSSMYDVARTNDGFVFHGYGSGHGVGLCQAGAAERGERGHSYRQILAFYFPGTALGVNARGFQWQRAGGERVDVETTDPATDGRLAALADRALREAERRAGFDLTFRPRVRVYETVAAFRDATGEPGWVAASTAGRTVRMQPSSILASRGVLEPVLLHEMLHLLVESRARANTPEWFREGLVLHLAGAATRPAAGSGDASRARKSYRQAHACVEKLERSNGRQALLGWLERGLPAGVAETSCDLNPRL